MEDYAVEVPFDVEAENFCYSIGSVQDLQDHDIDLKENFDDEDAHLYATCLH